MKRTTVKTLTKRLKIVPSTEMYARTLRDTLNAQADARQAPPTVYKPGLGRVVVAGRPGALAAALLIIASLVVCCVLYRTVTDLREELALARQDTAPTPSDDTTTINLYLKEHRDVVARYASLDSAAPQPAQIRVTPRDVLYYEIFDDGLEFMNPGIIVRGPSPRREIEPSEAPVISNGHSLTLSEARASAGFKLVSPAWLRPTYALDQIRRIEGRDALQLLYTDGIDTISLFEQPLDGRRGLEPKDFREYAVYRNTEQAGGTILAWKDDELSYVLIGNAEMSQLMDMAQSISAGR